MDGVRAKAEALSSLSAEGGFCGKLCFQILKSISIQMAFVIYECGVRKVSTLTKWKIIGSI